MVMDGAGGAILCWEDARSREFDVYTQRVSRDGNQLWSADGVLLCDAVGDQMVPVLTTDGVGGAIAAWDDFRSGEFDIYAQRVSALGVPLWTRNGVAVCTAPGAQYHQCVVSDGAGGAIIAWEDRRSGIWQVWVQRVNAAGQPQWPTDGEAISSTSTPQFEPVLAMDGAGGVVVVWGDFRNGNEDIYAQRFDALGIPQWATGGVPICKAPGDQGTIRIIEDGRGGDILTWIDERNGWGADIYSQRIDATGSPQWAINGLPLTGRPGEKGPSTLTTDGLDGAIVTWESFADGPAYENVFAQRVTAAGLLAWGANDVAITTAFSSGWNPTVAADSAGGAYLVWVDNRGGPTQCYVQHVNAYGISLWNPHDGLRLCPTSGNQWNAGILSDGQDEAIIAWNDDRRDWSNPDIYAQVIGSDGRIGAPAAAQPAEVFMAPPSPNPAREAAAILYRLPREGVTSLRIYDLSGRQVRNLWNGVDTVGEHLRTWDVLDDGGRRVKMGMYFVQLRVAGTSRTSRVAVLL